MNGYLIPFSKMEHQEFDDAPASAFDFEYHDVEDVPQGRVSNISNLPCSVKSEVKIDGVVYVAKDPSFFRIYPPLKFITFFTQRISKMKLRGLKNWHKEFVWEVKLGCTRDHTLRLIIAQ